MATEIKTDKGQLQEVFSKEDKKGKTIYMVRLVEDGPVYCTYSKDKADKLEKLTGQHVAIDYTGDEFKKIEDAKLAETTPAPGPKENTAPQGQATKETRMARSVGIKAAAAYLAGKPKITEKAGLEIIDLAKILTAWIQDEEAE